MLDKTQQLIKRIDKFAQECDTDELKTVFANLIVNIITLNPKFFEVYCTDENFLASSLTERDENETE